MDSYQRLYAAAHLQEYDRPPFCDNEWNEILGDMVPYLAGCSHRDDGRYGEEERAAAVRASMDMVPWSHVYDHPRYPILGPIPTPHEGQQTTDSDGFVWITHGYTEWIVRRPFAGVDGFVLYLERKAQQFLHDSPALPADFLPRLQHARTLLGETAIALPYLGAGLDALYQLAGWDIFAPASVEQPEAIAAYLDARARHMARLVHLYAEYITARDCPVALGAYADIACNSGLLLSPQFLRRVLKPAVRQFVAAYHEHGIKVIYHSEGNIRQFLDDLIDAGVDGINPLSPSENMDVVEIRRLYPRLILWGGIDERAALVNGTEEDVRQEVKRVVSGAGRGLILGSSGGVHPACRVRNCLAMVEALHAFA
jgi:hypothetical protein